jgi:hypothetical protein
LPLSRADDRSAGRPSIGLLRSGPSFCPHSPERVEGKFCEVHVQNPALFRSSRVSEGRLASVPYEGRHSMLGRWIDMQNLDSSWIHRWLAMMAASA